MKRKIFLFLSILLLLALTAVSTQAVDQQKVKMSWTQSIYPTIKEWRFYGSKTSGSGFIEIYVKSYVTGEGIVIDPDPLYPELEKRQYVQVIDLPDSLINKNQLNKLYFRAKAFGTDGRESAWSNEASTNIDLRPTPAPGLQCEAVK